MVKARDLGLEVFTGMHGEPSSKARDSQHAVKLLLGFWGPSHVTTQLFERFGNFLQTFENCCNKECINKTVGGSRVYKHREWGNMI